MTRHLKASPAQEIEQGWNQGFQRVKLLREHQVRACPLTSWYIPSCKCSSDVGEGRDESKRRRAESQWIVAARPLCHLQYPVAYLSRLQRILPAARWELRFKAARAALPPGGLGQRHVPLGDMPLLLVGKRTAGACVASSPDSDLEAFSHNPTHGSFAPLAFQPSAMTNCANQRFLSY